MSDPVIKRVRRSIDEARNRGGMQAGMPKVTIDAADAERLCIVAEALTTPQPAPDVAVLVRALERIANMGSMSYHSLESAKITARNALDVLAARREGGTDNE